MPEKLIITKQTNPVIYDLDLPIHPPYDARDAFDAIPMQLLPYADGLTVGWKVSPMQFVDGLGRDLKLDCPSIVITGGQNLGDTPVVLYVVAAFYDKENRLLSCQTSEHIVQPWESYDIPGLWSRFPFPITEIARASVGITSYGWEDPRPEEAQILSKRKPKPETKYEWKREGEWLAPIVSKNGTQVLGISFLPQNLSRKKTVSGSVWSAEKAKGLVTWH